MASCSNSSYRIPRKNSINNCVPIACWQVNKGIMASQKEEIASNLSLRLSNPGCSAFFSIATQDPSFWDIIFNMQILLE